MSLLWERVLKDLFEARFCSHWIESKINLFPDIWFTGSPLPLIPESLRKAFLPVWAHAKRLQGVAWRHGGNTAGFLQVLMRILIYTCIDQAGTLGRFFPGRCILEKNMFRKSGHCWPTFFTSLREFGLLHSLAIWRCGKE